MCADTETSIRVDVDPTNPGQFFACCGILELADRLWAGAEGSFEGASSFAVRPLSGAVDATEQDLVELLLKAPIASTMSAPRIARHAVLSKFSKRQREADGTDDEKRQLDAEWRECPIIIGEPFHLRIDWFADQRASGAIYKTWAGQQSVADIALGMQRGAQKTARSGDTQRGILSLSAGIDAVPFNFDSTIGSSGSDLDVGFSLDPLKSITRLTATCRPFTELLAFIGLQRFRPSSELRQNRHRYHLWDVPLAPLVALAAACGAVSYAGAPPAFEFRLLYRTKYLKSFLPARLLER